jgi:drug/metabolite transporter, DME family
MRHLGIAQILVSGFCFGFLGLFGKKAYSAGLSPGEFLALRFSLAALMLGGWFLLRDRSRLAIGKENAIRAFLLGSFGYALFSTCYFTALQGLSVSLTALLLYLYPVWVTVGSWLFLGEALSRIHLIALPVSLTGLVLLLFGEFSIRDTSFLAIGVMASVFYSKYILFSRKLLKNAPPLSSAFYVMLGAASVLSLLHLRSLPTEFNAWIMLSGTSLISTIAAISLFLAGLQKLSGAEASMLSLAEPFTAVLIGIIFFGDAFLPMQWAGALLISAGMVLTALAKKRT